jgi:hypothetical protein
MQLFVIVTSNTLLPASRVRLYRKQFPILFCFKHSRAIYFKFLLEVLVKVTCPTTPFSHNRVLAIVRRQDFRHVVSILRLQSNASLPIASY